VIVKHANPCGAAVGGSVADAYRKALASDPLSAFGGIVALSGEVDEELAAEISDVFTEVLVAPGYTPRHETSSPPSPTRGCSRRDPSPGRRSPRNP
jgi:AICAR transformylase/IMP cyclohydrolase PurH